MAGGAATAYRLASASGSGASGVASGLGGVGRAAASMAAAPMRRAARARGRRHRRKLCRRRALSLRRHRRLIDRWAPSAAARKPRPTPARAADRQRRARLGAAHEAQPIHRPRRASRRARAQVRRQPWRRPFRRSLGRRIEMALFRRRVGPLRPHAGTGNALSARRPGLGRPDRLGPRAGEELALDGLRFAAAVIHARRRPGLAIDPRQHRSLGGAGRQARAGPGRRAGDGGLRAERSADRLVSRALHRDGPLAAGRSHHRAPELAAGLRLTPRPPALRRSTTTPAPTIPSPSSATSRSPSTSRA